MTDTKALTHSLDNLLFSKIDMPNHYQQEQDTEDNVSLYTYAIVNAAGSDKLLMNLVAYEPEHRILFDGDDAEKLEDAAPWLVKLIRGENYTEWLLEECFGERLVLFMQSSENIDSLAEHLKHYTKIEFPDKTNPDNFQIGFFSFYDPSIFPIWAESLKQDEAYHFFQPISNVWYEEDEHLKLFYLKQNGWQQKGFEISTQTKKNNIEAIVDV